MGTKQQWNLHQVAKDTFGTRYFPSCRRLTGLAASGRADRWRNWGIVTLVVQVVAVVGGLPFGATGVAVVVVMTSLLIAVPSISYAEMVSDILQNVLPRTARSPTVLTFVPTTSTKPFTDKSSNLIVEVTRGCE